MEANEAPGRCPCLFGSSPPGSTRDSDRIRLQEKMHQLEGYIEEHLQRIRELEQQLTESQEQLDGERFRREILEADLFQHKEALIEKTHALTESTGMLQERDQTIQTQNCLLGFAWTETQNMATSQRNKNRIIEQLRGDMQELQKPETFNCSAGLSSKKRRLAP
ncbi:hypothetical protein Purlil1_12800 [Purpureocillium lilacinum]|uniref:Uncharacterized protein n=1 Tax=Purpureocillium lilacinum TaxID=33203 RepID=A0ABR0BFW8_PURLI|nr:hypothetical protein Purlil1_12800 [Purpureocillium lilacinum]